MFDLIGPRASHKKDAQQYHHIAYSEYINSKRKLYPAYREKYCCIKCFVGYVAIQQQSRFTFSYSTARQAMVNIMLASKPRQRDQENGIETGNLERGRRKGIPPQGNERSRGTGLACQNRVENSSRCIFWCAIALGALLKGSPLSFVSFPVLHTYEARCSLSTQLTLTLP